jgi:hypothetical protein
MNNIGPMYVQQQADLAKAAAEAASADGTIVIPT